MSFGEQKDVGPEKHTGITFQGKEIVLSKTRGRPRTGKGITDGGFHGDKKRIEALTIWAVTGNIAEVTRLTGVPYDTFRRWKKEDWFKEALEELRNENDHQFDSAFTEIVNNLISAINDRVANGDHVVMRDGSIIRKPVSLRDIIGAMMITIDKRQILRNKPTSISSQAVSTDKRLEQLVKHFENLAKKDTSPVVEDTPTADEDGVQSPAPLLVRGEDQPDEQIA